MTDSIDSIDHICAALRTAHATSLMPDGMQSAIDTFRAEHRGAVKDLTSQVSAVVLFWLSEAAKRVPEPVAEQVALQTAHAALMLAARAMKMRRGEDLDPARIALAAWHFATWVRGMDGIVPAKLEAVDALLDEIRTPIEHDRDRLRQALIGALHALRSYQHGNASTELAEEIADACEAALAHQAEVP